jgi:hypothetical protein
MPQTSCRRTRLMDVWNNLGGTFISAPRGINIMANHLAVFAVGADHQVYVRWRNVGEWGPWQAIGGAIMAPPIVVTRDGRSIDMFCISHDQSMCYRSWQGEWGPWRPLYGHVGGDAALITPCVIAGPSQQLDVLRIGADFQLYYKRYRSEIWDDWTVVHSIGANTISAIRSQLGLHLFSVGSYRRLRHTLQRNDEWEPSTVLNDQNGVSRALAAPHNSDAIAVYYLVTDRSLRYQLWDGSWTEPTSLEGTIVELPTVVVSPNERTDIFVVGEDRAVWQRSRMGDSWTWWRSLGGQAFAPISAVPQGSTRVELFTLARDSTVWHRTFIRS